MKYSHFFKGELVNFVDLRELTMEEEINEMKVRVLSWQLQRLLGKESPRKMLSVPDKKRKRSIWRWLSNEVDFAGVVVSVGRLVVDEAGESNRLSVLPELSASSYGCAIVHETQQSLREWLLREVPDLLVISTDKEPGVAVTGCYWKTPPAQKASYISVHPLEDQSESSS